jgi:hypothetical protein
MPVSMPGSVVQKDFFSVSSGFGGMARHRWLVAAV